MNILEALDDANLFAAWFQHRDTWKPWRTFLAALFGLPIEDAEIYAACTGGRPTPARQAREATIIAGRRGGKSFICALIAVFVAAFRTYHLSPGETGILMLIAADRRQARVLLRYVRAFLEGVSMLRQMVENITAEAIELNNGITIEIHTASFRSIRGRTVVAAVCDEVAFWRNEDSANPDHEIISALKPAMATIPDALLLIISTPYSRRGVLWTAYRHHFGKGGDTLIWQAPTRIMNPTVDQRIIDAAFEEDPAAAAAEYGAEFRSDVEAFISQEAVDACIVPNRHELPPVPGAQYIAFCDPSGGSQDAMTLAVGHAEGERAVLDLLRERRAPIQSRGRRKGVFRGSQALRDQRGHRRPIRRRVAAGEIPDPSRSLQNLGEIEV